MSAADPAAPSSATAAEALRAAFAPLDVPDLLDRAVGLYRDSFSSLFAIPLASGVVYFVLSQVGRVLFGPALAFSGPGGSMPAPEDLGELASLLAGTMTIGFAGLVLQVWATGALVEAISSRYLGRAVGIRAAARRGLARLPTLLGTSVVLLIGVVVALSSFVFPLVLASFVAAAVAPLLALFALVIAVPVALAAFLMVLRVWLHAAAVMIEGHGVFAALRRSDTLMRRRIGPGWSGRNDIRLSLVLLVMPAIALAVQMLASLPAFVILVIGGIAEFIEMSDVAALPQWAEGPLIATQVVGNALVQPFTVATTVLFYFDLRSRAEGFDLELRANALAGAGVASASHASGPR